MTLFTPIGRFLGFFWILVATIMIAARRPAEVDTAEPVRV
jgi:hypothetical protein